MLKISVLIFLFSEEKSEWLIQQERGGVRESCSQYFLLNFHETSVIESTCGYRRFSQKCFSEF